MIWLTIIGVLFLIYRIWVTEVKCKTYLGFRNRFFSRITCYYYAIGLIFSFQIMAINALVVSSVFSFGSIFLFFDVPFFFNVKKEMAVYPHISKLDIFWLLSERVTLHIPIISTGIWMMFDFTAFINMSRGIIPLIIGVLLFYIPFFLIDARWKEKADWPLGLIIFLFSLGQIGGMALVLNLLF